MNNIIKELVAIDAECAKKIEEAQQRKNSVQLVVNQKRDAIYQEYMNKLQVELKEHETKLKEQNINLAQNRKESYDNSLNKMKELYDSNKDKWIAEIVDRSLK